MQIYHKWSGLRFDVVEYCKENKVSEYDLYF